MDENEAAAKLQGMYRAKKAQEALALAAKLAIEKVYDEHSGCYFYFNHKTQESKWEKPTVLKGNNDALTPRSRKRLEAQERKRARGELKTAKDMSEEEAAMFIQRLYRTRNARKHIRQLLMSVYEKIYDEEGNAYYYNHKTGESQWHKPKLLGSDDLDELHYAEEKTALPMDDDDYYESKNGDVERKMEIETLDQVAERAQDRYQEGLESVQNFLKHYNLINLYERLVEEGFDDMDAVSAMQEEDIEEIGIKRRYQTPLYEAVLDYRKLNGMSEEQRESESDDVDDDEELESGDDGEDEEEDDSDDDDDQDVDDGKPVKDVNKEAKVCSDDDNDVDDDQDSQFSDAEINSIATENMLGITIESLFDGDGRNYPQKGQFALIHYVASLKNGTVFENSRKRGRPFDFLVGANHVIPGLDLAVRKLSRGQRANIIVQPEMAYGDRGRPPLVPPNSEIHFELELIDNYYAQIGELLQDEEDETYSDEDVDVGE